MRAWNRLNFARQSDNNSNMTIKGHQAMGIDLSPGAFLDICLEENARRLACYDSRLLRPEFMPRLVRAVRPLVGRR